MKTMFRDMAGHLTAPSRGLALPAEQKDAVMMLSVICNMMFGLVQDFRKLPTPHTLLTNRKKAELS